MNRGVDKEEFQKMMELMRTSNRQGARHRNGLRFGLKVTGSVEEGGLLEYFFGKDGNGRLEQEKFVQFLRDLHDEVCLIKINHVISSKCEIPACIKFSLWISDITIGICAL